MKTRLASGKILVPAEGPADWKRFLADPDKHWKPGHSAHTLAHAWHASDGLPEEIHAALESEFRDFELLLAVPEWQVPLPGGYGPSQNDVWALCRTETGLLSLGVEGKVAEPFGPTVGEWLKRASAGKQERLELLCRCLGLDFPPPASIRYQLLHRVTSAILEAERFQAAHAVTLVHSFHPEDRGFDDFAAFAEVFGVSVEKGRMHALPSAASATLHIGWIHGDERYRSA